MQLPGARLISLIHAAAEGHRDSGDPMHQGEWMLLLMSMAL